ncbi:restriction endonuclease PLD domain-containing protein [Aminicella lysinilytica]|uniref:NgoFVII restriction endonuclease n=1 Tax=Aminicella lysinilytica TaxID=433323 RepID=A0A4R6PWS6_9FIRM|nr:restriction endonuclease PLD domain-containing protein [Aminicella lysinilytica]TDP46459.1 NgoFVII restriction endonuclease [Aminicella lysinilytica]
MGIIYSDIPPLAVKDNERIFDEYFAGKMQNADEVVITVGYASKDSLIELDRCVRKTNVNKVILVLGMYCIEGFPESIYNVATTLNKAWKKDGIGEIRATQSMKYHGKVYVFYNDGIPFSAIMGSHNLGALVKNANNRRQYEVSWFTEDIKECCEISRHVQGVVKEPVSCPLQEVSNITIIHEENRKLDGVEGTIRVSTADVESAKLSQTNISFEIPLKVPGIPGSSNDFMKSNINKCYAKGRLNAKSGVVTERGWWETEIIVSKIITGKENYPEKNVPFYVITDDGWKFLMHVSGDYSKNFESDGDLKILGYWLKGRLVVAGVVEPVDSPSADLRLMNRDFEDIYSNCKGVISYQKLLEYGRTSVSLTKTINQLADEYGNIRDVWVLSFLPQDVR